MNEQEKVTVVGATMTVQELGIVLMRERRARLDARLAAQEVLLGGETPEARKEMARRGWVRRAKARPGTWVCCHRCGKPAPAGMLSPGGLCGACLADEADREMGAKE